MKDLAHVLAQFSAAHCPRKATNQPYRMIILSAQLAGLFEP